MPVAPAHVQLAALVDDMASAIKLGCMGILTGCPKQLDGHSNALLLATICESALTRHRGLSQPEGLLKGPVSLHIISFALQRWIHHIAFISPAYTSSWMQGSYGASYTIGFTPAGSLLLVL